MQDRELKERLIRGMGSMDNGIARKAARELWAHGWLQDGTLRRADLTGANLQGADLSEADLQGANFSKADLRDVRLRRANLEGARLGEANLRDAKMWDVNLRGADLRKADLRGANLWTVNLRGTRLGEADLRNAHLWYADLEDAADLTSEQLREVWMLTGGILPDGKCYVGEFDLEGDKKWAEYLGANVHDPQALASWYRKQCERAREEHRKLGWLGDDDGDYLFWKPGNDGN